MYGLVSFHQNFFVLVNDNYKNTKLVQHLFGSQFPTMCVNLKLYKCRTDEISQKNSDSYALSPRLARFNEADTSVHRLVDDDCYIDTRESFGLAELTEDQHTIKTNFKFVYEFLNTYFSRLALLEERKLAAIDQKIEGVKQLEEFLLLQTGEDAFISTLSANQQERIRRGEGVVKNYNQQLLNAIMNLNIKKDTTELIGLLQFEMQSFQPVLASGNKRQSQVISTLASKSLTDTRKRING